MSSQYLREVRNRDVNKESEMPTKASLRTESDIRVKAQLYISPLIILNQRQKEVIYERLPLPLVHFES